MGTMGLLRSIVSGSGFFRTWSNLLAHSRVVHSVFLLLCLNNLVFCGFWENWLACSNAVYLLLFLPIGGLYSSSFIGLNSWVVEFDLSTSGSSFPPCSERNRSEAIVAEATAVGAIVLEGTGVGGNWGGGDCCAGMTGSCWRSHGQLVEAFTTAYRSWTSSSLTTSTTSALPQ